MLISSCASAECVCVRFVLWFFAFRSALFIYCFHSCCMFHSLYRLHFMEKLERVCVCVFLCVQYATTCALCRLHIYTNCLRVHLPASRTHSHSHTNINHKIPLMDHKKRNEYNKTEATTKLCVPVAVCFICGYFSACKYEWL